MYGKQIKTSFKITSVQKQLIQNEMSKKREALREELRMHKNKTRKNTVETLIDENEEDEFNLK